MITIPILRSRVIFLENFLILPTSNVMVMVKAKTKCPRSGCNYYTDADNAKDALVDLQEHFQTVHGEQDIPDDLKRDILNGRVKREEKSSVR